jgi:hypothetical protein
MAHEPTATSSFETTGQGLAMCPECGIALVTSDVGRRSGGSSLLGELLIFAGLMVLFIKVVVALLLTATGVWLMSLGNSRQRLICPRCGATGTTLSQLARRARRHLGKRAPQRAGT